MPQNWPELTREVCDSLRDISEYDRAEASFISHKASDLSRPQVLDLKAQGAKVLDIAGEKAREYGQEALSKKDELVDKADRKLSGGNMAPEQTTPASTMA